MTGTVTFLFTDIEGSTERWQRDDRSMSEALAAHDHTIRAAVERHDGIVFKHTGDGMCRCSCWHRRRWQPLSPRRVLAAAGDHPDRLRSTASFAAQCGTSPIDASCGRQQHRRLNRGGDRQANCALSVIVMSRLRWHRPTKNRVSSAGFDMRTNPAIANVGRAVGRRAITSWPSSH